MKLIRKLNIRQDKKNRWIRWALFYCEYCEEEVEKVYYNGIRSASCGCAKEKLRIKKRTKHNDAKRGEYKRIYRIWLDMKQRCYNKKNTRYEHYGYRNIKICEEWSNEYVIFKNWALSNGYRDDLTIDRKDNDGDYEPDNCRWVTKTINNRNRPSTKLTLDKVRCIRKLYFIKGLTQVLISEIYGVTPSHISKIIRNKKWRTTK